MLSCVRVTYHKPTTRHPRVTHRRPTTIHPRVTHRRPTTRHSRVTHRRPTTRYPRVTHRRITTRHPRVTHRRITTRHPSASMEILRELSLTSKFESDQWCCGNRIIHGCLKFKFIPLPYTSPTTLAILGG